MYRTPDAMDLLEGHPFDDLLDAEERCRINDRVARLADADAAIKERRGGQK